MVIELGSHTDCRGNDDYNVYLSDRRAKSSAAYVQERIDNKDRIYGKGFGETSPNIPSPNGCGTLTEAQHQLNRTDGIYHRRSWWSKDKRLNNH